MGLAPKEPVGVIHTHKYSLYLYDPENPESVRPKCQISEKQREVLRQNREKAKLRRRYRQWRKYESQHEDNRIWAVNWARDVLSSSALILDTETTGFQTNDLVEIAVINMQGETLLNTLVKPSLPIEPGAMSCHGITAEKVAYAPPLGEIWQQIEVLLNHQIVLIYNADFDCAVLETCCQRYSLDPLELLEVHDVMECYATWFGQWNEYHRSYTWQPLNGGHRALGDCLATLARIQEMAQDSNQIQSPFSDAELAMIGVERGKTEAGV